MEPKLSMIIKLTLVLGILFLQPAYSGASPLGEMRISLIDGEVQIKTADTGD